MLCDIWYNIEFFCEKSVYNYNKINENFVILKFVYRCFIL